MRLAMTTVVLAALAAAAGATETTPEAAAYFNKGIELYNAGMYDEAIAQFEKSIAQDPNLVEGDEWIATIYLRQGNNAAAVERYQKLLARKPSTASRVSLGLAYLKTGDVPSAVKILKEAVAIDPKNAVGWNNLSMAYLRSGNNADAKAAAEKALGLDAGYAPAHVNLGNVYLADNDTDAAIASFNKALELDPNQADAFYGLGEAYSFAGDNQQAGDYYVKYLFEEADGRGASRARHRLAVGPRPRRGGPVTWRGAAAAGGRNPSTSSRVATASGPRWPRGGGA